MPSLPRSPLAPDTLPDLPPLPGVRLAGAATGLKPESQPDLMLALFPENTTVAGTLTRSRCPSAPVEWCRRHLPRGTARALVVNSGNANAFTGQIGRREVEATVAAAAALGACGPHEVFVAATGVIGVPLGENAVAERLPALASQLREDGWQDAAEAIRTTDTFPKWATRTATVDGVTVTLNGIAKGSGMIAPDMATMLAFVVTDAALPAPVLRTCLAYAVDHSFNSITVDSDTSTSDTVLAFATGTAGNRPPVDCEDPRLGDFRRALRLVCQELAHLVVRDGEGARKFVTLTITGAESTQAARRIGLSVANSPLVKTALAGEDANWGRLVMAVGKAGERAERDRLAITIGETPVTRDGEPVPGYDEAPVAAHLRQPEIHISIDVGVGSGRATVWTCDLTHDYIRINADYRS